MRRAARIDSNHQAIVGTLRKVGATVQSLATVGNGTPDLLVGFRGRTFLFEVKDGARPPSQRKLTDMEASWHQRWRGSDLYTVYSPGEALKIIGALE